MAGTTPYDILEGALTLYFGEVGATVPAVNVTPSTGWTELGETDGDQTLQFTGDIEEISHNNATATVKTIRPEEGVKFVFTLVGLTLENWATILGNAVVTAAGPPATKTMPLSRGRYPNEYAFIARGAVMSPYGALPGMIVLPRVQFVGEPEVVFSKSDAAGLEVEAIALWDDTQASGDELGWIVAQTA